MQILFRQNTCLHSCLVPTKQDCLHRTFHTWPLPRGFHWDLFPLKNKNNLSCSKCTIITVFHSIYLLISLRGRFPLHRLPTQGHRQPCTFTFHVFGLCDEARESLHKQSKNTQTPHRKVPSWTADSNPVPSSMTVPTTVPLFTAFLLPVTHPGHHQGGTGTFRHYWGRLDSEYNQTHLLWRPVNKNREHCKSSHNLRYKLSYIKLKNKTKTK